MKPVEELTEAEAGRLDGLLFDLDDTVLDHGVLTEVAYTSLFRLRELGLRLVAVTGRPAGWGEVLVRQWPVDAVVTENGAVTLHLEGRALRRLDAVDEAERRERRVRLARVASELQLRFDALLPADDVRARETDFTFDIGEYQTVPAEIVEDAIEVATDRGFRTARSSVHLHITLEADDKASGAVRALGTILGVDPGAALTRYAYIGDSENDAACFAAFRTTVGVANLSPRVRIPPRYRTSLPMGAGFGELADILQRRRGGSAA